MGALPILIKFLHLLNYLKHRAGCVMKSNVVSLRNMLAGFVSFSLPSYLEKES